MQDLLLRCIWAEGNMEIKVEELTDTQRLDALIQAIEAGGHYDAGISFPNGNYISWSRCSKWLYGSTSETNKWFSKNRSHLTGRAAIDAAIKNNIRD